MADMEFSRQDLEDLVRKVSQLQPYLSERERQLLMAIFAAAAERAKPFGPKQAATLPEAEGARPPAGDQTGEQPTPADLQRQLLAAYIPGKSFDSLTAGPSTPKISEGGTITPLPPAPGHT
jgi:hypothetical protein